MVDIDIEYRREAALIAPKHKFLFIFGSCFLTAYALKPFLYLEWQAETSEIWIQNPRELPNLQSASYYNMPPQTPHSGYMPSHTGHASFNAAAQSSHMQFPGGLYHPPPQPAAMANPHHHLGPAMGGNVGVAAAAPGAQVGAYQQPQLGHLNWTTNF